MIQDSTPPLSTLAMEKLPWGDDEHEDEFNAGSGLVAYES